MSEALNIHKHTILKNKPYPRIVLTGKGSKTRAVRITNKTLEKKLKSRITKLPITRQAVSQHIKRKAKLYQDENELFFLQKVLKSRKIVQNGRKKIPKNF